VNGREANRRRLSPIAGYRLPFEVQPDQIKATTRDDVLEVRIPRPAERRAEAKKIPVA
jgi:HSP20 family molecular chaperone IbpA